MGRYRFELATPADDPDLRGILAATEMEGAIAVSFRREPSFFEAAVVEGGFTQVVAARDLESKRLVGFGCRSVRERYVNGVPEPVGYLSGLRLLVPHRNQGLLARGYNYFRRLHADGRARLYVTTIAEGNRAALRLLTAGRRSVPAYCPAGSYRTAALVLSRRRRRPERQPRGCEVRPATTGDLPAIVEFCNAWGRARQFFPRYRENDFFTASGTFRDLEPADLLLALGRGEIVGMLGAWDQRCFRQTVVSGYHGPWRYLRPVYGATSRLLRLPQLPAPGQELRYLTGCLPLARDDDPCVFQALVEALLWRASTRDLDYVLVGLHERDPLQVVLRRFRAIWYTTYLYVVSGDDGRDDAARLDSRVPYLELGTL